MIKINLKNTKTSATYLNTVAGFTANQENTLQTEAKTFLSSMSSNMKSVNWSSLEAGVLIRIAFNLILISSIVLALKIYEIQNIRKLKGVLSTEKKILEDKKQRVATLSQEIKKLGKYEKEALEFDNKKDLFKKLAKRRLQVPRFLDQIQATVPEYVWFESIKLSIKDANISISGESTSEDKVTQFINDLGSSVIDSNTSQFNTSDVQGKNVSKIKFDVTGKLLLREEEG